MKPNASISASSAKTVFDRNDINKDGYLNIKEFESSIKEIFSQGYFFKSKT